MDLRGNVGRVVMQNWKLVVSREGFIHRAALLFNSIDQELRNKGKIEKFKTGLMKWLLENISMKPMLKRE